MMRSSRTAPCLSAFCLLLLAALAAPAQQLPPPSREPVDVPRIEGKVSVDGRLDEPAWQQALILDLPVETQPGDNIPASIRTEVRVFYGRDAIYFGLECFDPDPSAIRARFAERDQFESDDLINVNLDTFNDERRNYYFGCNPLGVQKDGLETTGGDQSWDAIWASAAHPRARLHHRDGHPLLLAAVPAHRRAAGVGLDVSRWYPRSQRRRMGLVPIPGTTTATSASS